MKWKYLVIISFFLFTTSASAQSYEINIELEPDPALSEWTGAEPPKVYEGDDLFVLINGGADLFFEYGFQNVVLYRYVNNQAQRIRAEVYEMEDDHAAYGIYLKYLPKNANPLESVDKGYITESYLGFWKGKFFCIITLENPDEEVQADAIHLAGIFDEKLKGEGTVPEVCSYMPDKGLLTTRYFEGNIGLSNVYHFDYRDHFNVYKGSAGDYGDHKVILFSYEESGKADEVYEQLTSVFSGHTRFSSFTKFEDHFEMLDRKEKGIFVTIKEDVIVAIIMDVPEWDYLPYEILSQLKI
jgi:hypothetical protein